MNLSLLLVEDNPSIMVVTTGLLRSLPMSVFIIVAKNGKSGLDSFKNYYPDLVLSDIDMPEMNGIQMLGEIRKINPTVPVILMSGGDHDLEMLKAAGMTEFLPKPFDKDQLLMSIDDALKKQQKS